MIGVDDRQEAGGCRHVEFAWCRACGSGRVDEVAAKPIQGRLAVFDGCLPVGQRHGHGQLQQVAAGLSELGSFGVLGAQKSQRAQAILFRTTGADDRVRWSPLACGVLISNSALMLLPLGQTQTEQIEAVRIADPMCHHGSEDLAGGDVAIWEATEVDVVLALMQDLPDSKGFGWLGVTS
ncbi:hypothetical protein [Streptomyces fagopyri]|uniref:hypothetical protein n=1 Tax=Streptomyces fagopyri TaxID=2662397 RepID=UPI0033D8833D